MAGLGQLCLGPDGSEFVVAGNALDQDAKSCGTVLELVRDACPSNGSLPRWNNKVGSLLYCSVCPGPGTRLCVPARVAVCLSERVVVSLRFDDLVA